MSRKSQRRRFISVTTGAIMGSVLAPAISWSNAAGTTTNTDKPNSTQNLGLTPRQSEGPFYPINDQVDKDTDLTLIEGKSEAAQGQLIRITGYVRNQSGAVINNAQVEIWQANAAGRYQHIRDRNHAAVDPNFQGWGISRSTLKGEYKFTTVLPGAYPASSDWIRPPHIHFKVSKPGYQQLITQMYFPEQALNASDLILNSLSNQQLPLLIAKKIADKKGSQYQEFVFNIVLQPLP